LYLRNKAKKMAQNIGYIGHLTILSNIIENNLKQSGKFSDLLVKSISESKKILPFLFQIVI
jgi:hypothetical protein